MLKICLFLKYICSSQMFVTGTKTESVKSCDEHLPLLCSLYHLSYSVNQENLCEFSTTELKDRWFCTKIIIEGLFVWCIRNFVEKLMKIKMNVRHKLNKSHIRYVIRCIYVRHNFLIDISSRPITTNNCDKQTHYKGLTIAKLWRTPIPSKFVNVKSLFVIIFSCDWFWTDFNQKVVTNKYSTNL